MVKKLIPFIPCLSLFAYSIFYYKNNTKLIDKYSNLLEEIWL
jgi:hypothetical protein